MNRQQADLSQPHDRILELAAGAVDFDLTSAEAAELEAHLTICPACARRAAALRTDAQILDRPVTVLPSPRVDAAIFAAITRRPAQPHRLLLVAAAALLLLTLLGTLAVGAALLRSRETLPTTLVPNPPTPVVVATASPVPTPLVADMLIPKCPAPQQQLPPPVVSASAGNGQVVTATRGSYTTMTCSTTGTADAAPKPPEESLAAYPGDTIELTVPAGWHFVRWEGSHEPLAGAGGGGWPQTDLPDKPRSIALSGPLLSNEIVSLTVVLVSDDERTVIEVGLQLLVNQSVS
jgi:hypothetical protein